MPAWVGLAVADYARRLPPELKLEIVEIPLGGRSATADPAAAVAAEGRALLKAVGARDTLVALDVAGNPGARRSSPPGSRGGRRRAATAAC